jgi:hypothetical protein
MVEDLWEVGRRVGPPRVRGVFASPCEGSKRYRRGVEEGSSAVSLGAARGEGQGTV